MTQRERLEQNRLIFRTLACGFVILVLFTGWVNGFSGIGLVVFGVLFLGWICALLWKKWDPVTDDDIKGTYVVNDTMVSVTIKYGAMMLIGAFVLVLVLAYATNEPTITVEDMQYDIDRCERALESCHSCYSEAENDIDEVENILSDAQFDMQNGEFESAYDTLGTFISQSNGCIIDAY